MVFSPKMRLATRKSKLWAITEFGHIKGIQIMTENDSLVGLSFDNIEVLCRYYRLKGLDLQLSGTFEANVTATGGRATESTPTTQAIASMISVERAIPISIQLDGREIMRVVKKGLAETAAFSARSFTQQTKA